MTSQHILSAALVLISEKVRFWSDERRGSHDEISPPRCLTATTQYDLLQSLREIDALCKDALRYCYSSSTASVDYDARITSLLHANNRELELRREAERQHRKAASTARLYEMKFHEIAEMVGLKDGDHIEWLEPDEVVEAVEKLVEDAKEK
jgi:hypothetical protein